MFHGDLDRLDQRRLLRRHRPRPQSVTPFSFQPLRLFHPKPVGLAEYVWDPVFETRRLFDIAGENTPYIEILGQWDKLEDAIQAFIRGEDDISERFETMVRDFKAFCEGASIEGLETGKGYASTSKAFSVDNNMAIYCIACDISVQYKKSDIVLRRYKVSLYWPITI
jgi:hypothetical protein